LNAYDIYTNGMAKALESADKKMSLIYNLLEKQKSVTSDATSPPLKRKRIHKSTPKVTKCADDTVKLYRPPRDAIMRAASGSDDALTSYYDWYMSLDNRETPRGVQKRLKIYKKILDEYPPQYSRGITGYVKGDYHNVTVHMTFNCMTISHTSRQFTATEISNVKSLIQSRLDDQTRRQSGQTVQTSNIDLDTLLLDD